MQMAREDERRYTAAELYDRAAVRLRTVTGREPSERYKELMRAFAGYFAREESDKLQQRKGILLSGCTGCGKTTLFRIFDFATLWACDQNGRPLSEDNARLFGWRSCRQIAMEYADRDRGGAASLMRHFTGVSCFDDFGAENVASHYGNKADVMGEIIQSRYERRSTTYITTNLTFAQIQQTYGERVASRLAEMCSWLDMGINEDYRR